MNKFVTALLRLLGGLTAAAALAWPMTARPEATPQEPIPYPIWIKEEVAPGGYYHALALDSLDRPHLLYQDTETWAVYYATRDGDAATPGEWQLEAIVTTPGAAATYSYDIAIRPDDTPCLVYAIAPSALPLDTKLVYGCRGPAGWELDEIDDGGTGAQLALDAAGRAHIALTQGKSLVYLTWQDDHWWRDTVAGDSSWIAPLLLTTDAQQRPYLVYRAYQEGNFTAVLQDNGVWAKTLIEAEPFGAPRLDGAGRLWMVVAHLRDTGGHPPMYVGELLLARPDDASGHELEVVDENLGPFASFSYDLALDGQTPHLVYSSTGGLLRYLWWTEEGRHIHSVDEFVDGQVRVAMGSDGQPRLSFSSGGQLTLATRRIILLDEAVYLPGVVSP